MKGSLSTGDIDKVVLIAWPDADLAGDFMFTKTTSGFFWEARGADGRSFSISWRIKKQGCTAQHTVEAETINLTTCLRSEPLPAQFLLQKLIRKPANVLLMEDNEATITSTRKGYSPAMRHLPRVHRIAIGLLYEITTREKKQTKIATCGFTRQPLLTVRETSSRRRWTAPSSRTLST